MEIAGHLQVCLIYFAPQARGAETNPKEQTTAGAQALASPSSSKVSSCPMFQNTSMPLI